LPFNFQKAEQLFRERPEIYKDPNHKPEMAIALTTPFEALCGFLDEDAIKANLNNYPELTAIVGGATADAFKAGSGPANIKSLFCAFMEADKDLCSAEIDRLVARLQTTAAQPADKIDRLILRLNAQYPNDRCLPTTYQCHI
jgi:mannose-6-phosphate isomerase